MAKARVLEITLSVMGAEHDGYPDPGMLQIADTAGVSAEDRLVVSVRIRGAKKYARHWTKAGWRSAIMERRGSRRQTAMEA